MTRAIARCAYCDYALERHEIIDRACGYLCTVCVGRVSYADARWITS